MLVTPSNKYLYEVIGLTFICGKEILPCPYLYLRICVLSYILHNI